MQKNTVQQALPPDAAPLRFAAQVKRRPLGAHICETTKSMEYIQCESVGD